MLGRARTALPELPAARVERLERELDLPGDTAKLLSFRADLGDFYEAALASDGGGARSLANWTTNELTARIGDADPAGTSLEPAAFARLVRMVADKEISAAAGREVLDVLVSQGGDPSTLVAEKGLGRAGEDEL